MGTKRALDVVRQLAASDVSEVALIGGEAYLRHDWHLLARAIADQGTMCSMVTGGRRFDAALAGRARDAGVTQVSVSIDGLEATHDAQRGLEGSHRSALAALEHLTDAGVPASVITQLNRRSAAELEPLFDVLRSRQIWAWRIHLTVPMGRAVERPEWLLQPYDLLDLFPRLARLKEESRANDILLLVGDNVGYFGPFETLLRNPSGTGPQRWPGCQAGRRTFGIQSDGTVKGCLSLPTAAYAGPDLRSAPLEQAIAAAAVRDACGRVSNRLWGFCRSCRHAVVCRGGCTWTAHSLLGRPGNNPYCHHRALELEKRGLRERLVPAEPAPGLPFDSGRFDLTLEAARGQ